MAKMTLEKLTRLQYSGKITSPKEVRKRLVEPLSEYVDFVKRDTPNLCRWDGNIPQIGGLHLLYYKDHNLCQAHFCYCQDTPSEDIGIIEGLLLPYLRRLNLESREQ